MIRTFGFSDRSDAFGYDGGGLEMFVHGSEGLRPGRSAGTVYGLLTSSWLRFTSDHAMAAPGMVDFQTALLSGFRIMLPVNSLLLFLSVLCAFFACFAVT